MKEIRIETVSNGFLITVTRQGNQSMYDSTNVYVAKDKAEVIQIVSDNA